MSLQVVETVMLPLIPSDRENVARIVRHGLKDVLEWLGEEVGPKPYEKTHCVVAGRFLYVSPEVYAMIKEEIDVIDTKPLYYNSNFNPRIW